MNWVINTERERFDYYRWNHARHQAVNPGREFEILYGGKENNMRNVIVWLDGGGEVSIDADPDFPFDPISDEEWAVIEARITEMDRKAAKKCA